MKIFLIDDEEVSLFLTQQMLVNSGLTEDIHPFMTAEEAINYLKACNEDDIPNVILLDLSMPVMNGWEFLDALAPLGDGFTEKCRIYILTSSLDDTDEEGAKSHPMVSGLLQKPISRKSVRIISSLKSDAFS